MLASTTQSTPHQAAAGCAAQINDFLRNTSRLRMVAMMIYNTSRGSQADMRWVNTMTAVSKGHIVDRVVGVAPGPYRSKQLFPAELWDSWLQLIRDHCNFEHSTLAPIDWSSTPLGDSTHETEAVLQQDSFWATMCGGLSFAMDEQNNSRSWCRVVPETDFAIFKRWHAWVLSWFDTKLHNSGVRLFHNNHSVTAEGRQFAVTEKSFIGWVPLDAQVEDVVAVLAGGKVPYVLRLCEDMGVGDKDQAPRYKFLGDAYVHGIMDGETVDEEKGIQGEIWLV